MCGCLLSLISDGKELFFQQCSKRNTRVNQKSTQRESVQIQTLLQMPVERLTQVKDGIIHEINVIHEKNPLLINRIEAKELAQILDGDKAGYSCVAINANKIKGVLLARENQDSVANKAKDGIKIVVIQKLAVVENDQKNGIATSLVRFLAKTAMQNNVDEIRLCVLKTNEMAMKFYFNRGFEYVDKKHDEPWDAFLLKASPKTLYEKNSTKNPSAGKEV